MVTDLQRRHERPAPPDEPAASRFSGPVPIRPVRTFSDLFGPGHPPKHRLTQRLTMRYATPCSFSPGRKQKNVLRGHIRTRSALAKCNSSAPIRVGFRTPIGAPFLQAILSTKYCDGDVGLYYYGHRYCAPCKSGASCGVKVSAGQGFATHPYRVLQA